MTEHDSMCERIAQLEAALYEISENAWTPAAIGTIQEIARAALEQPLTAISRTGAASDAQDASAGGAGPMAGTLARSPK